MGNCSLKGVTGQCPNIIGLQTDSGNIIESKGPRLVKDVISEYPGYGVFRQAHASSPLSSYEYLIGGQMYYLLPLRDGYITTDTRGVSQIHNFRPAKKQDMDWVVDKQIESTKKSSSGDLANGLALEVLPSLGNGVWRVKIVINTKQLEEILSEQVNTGALIEKMRMAANSASFRSRRSRSSEMGWKPVTTNVFTTASVTGGKL